MRLRISLSLSLRLILLSDWYFGGLLLIEAGILERRLLNRLFLENSYNRLERPVLNDSESLAVRFGLVLQQIIDVDEKNQILISNIWLNLRWNDYNLSWNESEYGGIKSIRIPPANIWKPDIYMYNSADEDIDSTFPTNVVVSSSGDCLWVPPGLFLSTCKIDITWFPFDAQRCQMKFGSWTYDSSGIDLNPETDSGDISGFIPNGEWELLGVPAEKHVVQYDCCPEKFIDVTFTVRIQRRKLYYIFNLVVPCMMMSCLSLLVFSMPPDAGEKITCGVTILLSLTVFLQLVAETMPPTSDAVPLIGMYFACIMVMCSLSMVFTVLVLNYHYRSPDTHQMPHWVRMFVCDWLARIFAVRRPRNCSSCVSSSTKTSSSKKKLRHSPQKNSTASELIQQNSSRSLLANVLDLDDDFLLFNITGVKAYTGSKAFAHNNHDHNCVWGPNDSHPTTEQTDRQEPEETSCIWQIPDSAGLESTRPLGNELIAAAPTEAAVATECGLLIDVLKEVRFLTGRIRSDGVRQEICNDWKFAAMVIDRVCLWMFTLFTIISTLAILFSAPSMYSIA